MTESIEAERVPDCYVLCDVRHLSCGGEPRVHREPRRFGSDGLRSLRASGENVLNNLRALMKKQNRETQDVSEQPVSIEITGPVFVNIEGRVAEKEEKERHVQDESERNTQGGPIH